MALLHSFAESIFHDAILQRVETDDHQPSARFQHLRGRIQQRLQVFQFMVYEDSECLESSCRGMNPPSCLSSNRFIGRAAADMTSASCAVVRIGRDRTMALAILRDLLSSPNS